jgi:hypothetical protein
LKTDIDLESLQRALESMILYEPWDDITRNTVKVWLDLQGLSYLLPDRINDDHSVTVCVKLDGYLHVFSVG